MVQLNDDDANELNNEFNQCQVEKIEWKLYPTEKTVIKSPS